MSAPPTASAATALREAFGDRKVPDITRKITACVLCRKLKIKCHMNDSKPPCTRCKARGLSCTVNKSLQALLESDASWKEGVERRLERVERALMNDAGQQLGVSSLNIESRRQPAKSSNSMVRPSRSENILMNPFAPVPTKTRLNLYCHLGAFPASSMMNSTVTDGDNSDYKPDLISCGLIPLQRAEDLFSFYKQHLDPCMHFIIGENQTLASLRARSPLLTAAVCTVAAFCTSSTEYNACINAFKHEVSGKLFSNRHTFDDVRALCIGAMWLNEISSALNSLAVRIASELDLHRCITKMPHTKLACYDRTRLYFLVYICDHHCSLVHGRPPMTRDMQTLKSPGALLQSKFSTSTDIMLISQVELWSISSRVFDVFGADIERSVASHMSTELDRLQSMYERWHQKWLSALSLKGDADDFSLWIFDLYFHSAKLFLSSHAFRGPLHDGTNVSSEFTTYAIGSALSIIRCIVEAKEPSSWLRTLPAHFGIMAAFASVSLIRTTFQQQANCSLETIEILRNLQRLVEVLETSFSAGDHPPQVWGSIARSLKAAMETQQHAAPEEGNQINESPCYTSLNFDLFMNDALDLDLLGSAGDWILPTDTTGL